VDGLHRAMTDVIILLLAMKGVMTSLLKTLYSTPAMQEPLAISSIIARDAHIEYEYPASFPHPRRRWRRRKMC